MGSVGWPGGHAIALESARGGWATTEGGRVAMEMADQPCLWPGGRAPVPIGLPDFVSSPIYLVFMCISYLHSNNYTKLVELVIN